MASTAAGASSSAHRAARAAASSGIKTGWIYDGSIKDQGYDEEWYDGQLYLQKELHIQAQFVQNEPYTSQWTSTDLSMATNGAQILYDPGDGGSLFYAACAKLPKVACIESNGVEPFPSNVDSVYPANWLASYLEGMAAGEVSKKGVIGFLAAYPNTPAPVIETLNALVLGCQATHPGCKAIVDVVNSWYNPPVENEDLNALVDAGADILASTNNDPAAIEVAEKRGVWGIGSWANGVSSGPKAFITSQVINWGPTLLQLTKQVISGTYHGGKIIVFGFGPGMQLAPWGKNVPSSVRSKVDGVEANMEHGKNYFCGPIYDNSGKLRVAAGTCMSQLQIYDGWSWYVRGVSISK
jgi:basic membrane lipoprotein Med (substrate-binding protein (PBP1-ABC) superfamily)